MTVYILVRHDGTSSLILGVFQRSLDARVYVQEQFGESPAAWLKPRPGRQYWSLEQPCFIYSIEEHTVNSGHRRDQHLGTLMSTRSGSNGGNPDADYFTEWQDRR